MTKPTVELIGQDGNAFVIIGLCVRAARKAGWEPDKINEFKRKAFASDYDNLLCVAMEYFEVV